MGNVSGSKATGSHSAGWHVRRQPERMTELSSFSPTWPSRGRSHSLPLILHKLYFKVPPGKLDFPGFPESWQTPTCRLTPVLDRGSSFSCPASPQLCPHICGIIPIINLLFHDTQSPWLPLLNSGFYILHMLVQNRRLAVFLWKRNQCFWYTTKLKYFQTWLWKWWYFIHLKLK